MDGGTSGRSQATGQQRGLDGGRLRRTTRCCCCCLPRTPGSMEGQPTLQMLPVETCCAASSGPYTCWEVAMATSVTRSTDQDHDDGNATRRPCSTGLQAERFFLWPGRVSASAVIVAALVRRTWPPGCASPTTEPMYVAGSGLGLCKVGSGQCHCMTGSGLKMTGSGLNLWMTAIRVTGHPPCGPGIWETVPLEQFCPANVFHWLDHWRTSDHWLVSVVVVAWMGVASVVGQLACHCPCMGSPHHDQHAKAHSPPSHCRIVDWQVHCLTIQYCPTCGGLQANSPSQQHGPPGPLSGAATALCEGLLRAEQIRGGETAGGVRKGWARHDVSSAVPPGPRKRFQRNSELQPTSVCFKCCPKSWDYSARSSFAVEQRMAGRHGPSQVRPGTRGAKPPIAPL